MNIRYDYNPYESILIVEREISKETFLKRCGAEKGFAATALGEIYDSIFAEAEWLEESYERYYKLEYPASFMDYIRREFLFPHEIASEIEMILKEYPECTLIRWKQLDYGKDGVSDFLFCEDVYPMFQNAICPLNP